jgi:predicted phage-related endonuclease
MSLSEEDLALRRTGISGSDLAAIVGASPFATPMDV